MHIPTVREITDIKCFEQLAAGGAGGPFVSLSVIEAWLGEDRRGAIEWCSRQEDLGYVEDDGRLSHSKRITSDGLHYLATLQRQRADKGLRRGVCRQRLLHWVDSGVTSTGASAHTNDFLLSEHAWFAGDVFAAEELHDAADYLVTNGLLRSLGKGWGAGHVRVGITHEGQECVTDYDADPAAYLRAQQQTGTVINVRGERNAVAVALGANSSATAAAIDIDAAILVAQAFRQAETMLDLDDEDRRALEDIEQRSDDSRVRRGLRRLGRFANETGTNAIGSVLAAVALRLVGGS